MSLSYCGSCGEPVEGRFCRMCGTPYAEVPAEAVAATTVQQLPYQATQPVYRPTPTPPQVSEFEGLFRPAEGEVSAYSHTQLIQPVEADYRMPPPGGRHSAEAFKAAQTQIVRPQSGDGYQPRPGADEPGDWDDDEPRGLRKPVVWGTLVAVVAASAVILGLLYIGSHNNNSAGDNAGVTNTPTAVAPTQQTPDSVNLPSGTAAASPSASASASASPSASASAGSTSLPLSLGSTGSYVHYVQTRLRELGYYQGDITGQYDQATAQAVGAFQARAGVTADPSGTVGRSTLTALIAAGSQPNLRFGERSGDVRRLQQALNSAENAGLTLTGKYDLATYAAVGRYQQAVGVHPSGVVNTQTWDALQSGHIV